MSRLSRSVKQTFGLEHTPYLEYTCQSLLEAAEFESDLVLGLVVRSEILIMSISRISGGSVDIKAPPLMQAELAKADLQKCFLALPSTVQEHS